MLSSLRTRLWLSYALIIAILLIVVALGLVWAFFQAPRLLYPETVFRMRVVSETISQQVQQSSTISLKKAESYLAQEATARNMRMVLIDANQKVLVDTGGPAMPYARILRADQLRRMAADQVRLVRLRGGGVWLYMIQHLTNGGLFLVMSPAPDLPINILFRDQFVSTFMIAGGIALALAFFLALLMGNWITAPLRRMVSASRAVAHGEHISVPVEGPTEVQVLAQAMNEMSQRVATTQQSQRDFVANVSHELKTPLTSIQGFSQAILDNAVQTPEALRQAAEVIFNEAGRMHRLVLDLLSLARLEAGTADLERAPVNLDLLLGEVARKFTPQAQAAQVKLDTNFEDVPVIPGDGDHLAQLFSNLLDNAIKFTPAGGQVMLTCQAGDGSVTAIVADTGKGIAPADQARIFERFYQVDKSRKGGTGRSVGLGLAIARQIVLAHSGQIWVESSPGQGSRFVVKLPLVRANPPAPTPTSKGKR